MEVAIVAQERMLIGTSCTHKLVPCIFVGYLLSVIAKRVSYRVRNTRTELLTERTLPRQFWWNQSSHTAH